MQHLLVHALQGDQMEKVRRVLAAALNAADPQAAVRRVLSLNGERLTFHEQELDLNQFKRILVIGAGKASQAMTRGALDVLGDRVTAGLIIAKHLEDGGSALPERIRVLPGGHPIPTQDSVSSTRALVDFLAGAADDDLVICLISGGGSALMTLPVGGAGSQDEVGLPELQELTRLLLACGADIGEINTLRKHLDRIKGGGLARLAAPARVLTLILSDVMGSPLDVIASGPTVADPSTFADALAILRKYQLEDRVPVRIFSVLKQGERGEIPESVKPGERALNNVTNLVVASNAQAAEAALGQARDEGFHTLLLTTFLQGEASQAGVVLAGLLKQVAATGQPVPRPACIVAGGETTVTLRGSGLGGRNQEMALGAVFLLDGIADAAFVTLGTDGEDGPTDAAGAVATGETLRRARSQGQDPQAFLRNNDSYHFFESLGDLLQPGPTGTNVNDLAFLFAF